MSDEMIKFPLLSVYYMLLIKFVTSCAKTHCKL